MKIFFSHSSAQKPLVREIRKILPEHINTWIDEEKLLIGDSIEKSLEAAIKKETDYILLFIDTQSVASKWVAKEIAWTLEQEAKLDRVFLLPVVVDAEAWKAVKPALIKQRKHLRLEDYSEPAVRSLGKRITSELFSLICRDIQNLRSSTNATKASSIVRTDQALNEIAEFIQRAVFHHRVSEPLGVGTLRSMLKKEPAMSEFDLSDFDTLIHKIIQSDLIPGLIYDGVELFLEEEHYKWKRKLSLVSKQKVARTAASMIRSGHKIALDAGSTTDELARILCTRLENKSLFNISIVTTSISAANIFLETGTRLGFNDDNSAFKLYVAGGRVRPNTLAVVEFQEKPSSQLEEILQQLGGVDFSIIGVNGIHADHGLTTHKNPETRTKFVLMKYGRKRLILGDSSKLGIIGDVCFAGLNDDIIIIINEAGEDPHYVTLLERAGTKLQIAK